MAKKPKHKNGVTLYEPETQVPITRHLQPLACELLDLTTGEVTPILVGVFEERVREELAIIGRETNTLLYHHAGQSVPPGNGFSNAKAREFFRAD